MTVLVAAWSAADETTFRGRRCHLDDLHARQPAAKHAATLDPLAPATPAPRRI